MRLSCSSSTSVITANGDTTIALSGTNSITCTTVDNPAITGTSDVTITGNGSVSIVSADKGIHSDETVTIGTSSDNPTVSIDAGDEGIEGNIINLMSGNGTITADDDGMNGDTDTTTDTSGCLINIAGGTWVIDAACDGLDSNGSISVSGGYTTVYGSTENNDAALDYDYNCTYTGGTFAAIGTSGMAQTPNSGTYVRFTGTSLSNGDTITIKDSSGNSVYSTSAIKSANDIVLSENSIVSGNTYQFYVNGSQISSSTATSGNNGGQGGPGGQGGEQGGPGGQGGEQGGPGGGSTTVSYSGATTITSDTTADNQSYTSTVAEQNALLVSGGTSTITNATVTKSGSPSGSSDNYDFYGTNAGVLVYNGATLNVKNATVDTTSSYASGLFAYGTGTINVSDTTINTSSNNSGAVMVTGGGTLTADNVTAVTQGNSSAAIRSDRGGETLTVNGGSYTTNGTGSPVIYSTANIIANNATLNATKSEGVVVEGANSVTLNGATLTDTNNQLNGQSTTYKNIFLYQSQSGDAAVGTSSFTAKNSNITTNKGDTFYITNTTAVINLENNTFINNDSTGAFLRTESAKWGTSGSNGGDVTLNMTKQTAKGDIVADSISTLNMSLSGSSSYTGTINGSNTAKSIALTLDSSSKITLTGDSYVTTFSNADTSNSNINFNGYKLYVNGTAISGSSTSTNVTLNKSTLTLGLGQTATLIATTDNATTLSWKSSNKSVATVTSKGKICTKGTGTATITVTTADGNKATCKVTVKQAPTSVALNKTSVTLGVKQTCNLTATLTPSTSATYCSFSSSDTSVATVNASGKVVAKKTGTATITVKTSNGLTATCKVTVKQAPTSIALNKTSATLGVKQTCNLTATLTPSTSATYCSFTSSDTSVATVNASGKVVAKTTGTATITVKTSNGLTATCKITVKKAPTSVTLNKTSVTLKKGSTETLTATLTPSTSATYCSFSSSDTSVATVNSNGVITAKKVGTATITVKTSNGLTSSCAVTVTK